jgi:16S rRNA (cytidine1402-2'-O)-methyltransferase
VATPIGNLSDLSLRAIEVLSGVDLIACEDTRHARHLLEHHGINTRVTAVHQHNEAGAAQKLVDLIAQGQRVALISDAGTPGISDPGARTVAAVQAAGLRIVPIPGASAAITAMSAAGLADTPFHFVGFLPAKVSARRTAISALTDIPAALVFYESPHRIADLLEVLGGEREIVIARELTKLFEQIVRLPLDQAAQWLAADSNHARGEFVLIVSAPPPRTDDELSTEAQRVLRVLLAELPTKSAAKLAAEITGASRNSLYARALALKDGNI